MEQILKLNINLAQEKPNLYKNREEMNCPFCNIEQIKKDGLFLEKEPNEPIYWVENKFPIFSRTYQTLILETDNCKENFKTYSLPYIQQLINYTVEKKRELEASNKFEKVLVFKNSGFLSGGTIPHSHTQIVGVEQYEDGINTESFTEGLVIRETSSAKLTLSNKPMADGFEFNISWDSNHSMPIDAAYYLSALIKYMDVFQNGKYKDYNLVIEDIDGRTYIKLLYRRIVNLLLLAYRLHPVPNNLEEVTSGVSEYLKNPKILISSYKMHQVPSNLT